MLDVTNWDEGLTDAQRAVATHGHSPLIVIAGAGTGKTRALIARVAYLLSRGTPADRILLLTFTRRAADDMLARAAFLARLTGNRRTQGGTFHSVAHRYVAAHAPSLGLNPGFGILDPAEATELMDILRADHDLSGTRERFPRAATLVEIYSRCVNRGASLSEVVPVDYPWCAPHVDNMASLFRAYSHRKRDTSVLDFDDLLLNWRAILADDVLGPTVSSQFDYVLVDEYQDVNGLQVDIVRHLTPQGRGLTVVGDEAQAVYGFRGADSKFLRELILEHADATVMTLEQNFRSRQAILDVANEVRPRGDGPSIRLHTERGPGVTPVLRHCHDAPGEARAIVDDILEAHEDGLELREQAVLVRAGHHSDLVEMELTARRVPFRKYGGLKFLEAAHVKDFIAAARLAANPHDELAWYRVLRLHQGIGTARARALLDEVRLSSSDPLESWPTLVARAPVATREQLATTLSALHAARDVTTAGERSDAVFAAIRALIHEHYVDAPSRIMDLERLASAAQSIDDLGSWLAEITLDPPHSTSDLAGPPHIDEDFVIISTIHSAKGLEWSNVHIPHVIDGNIPIDMALGSPEGLEEERRLFYVAVTRARERLNLYAPLRMPHHRHSALDRHSFAPISRFIDGVVREHLVVEEQTPVRLGVGAVHSVTSPVDLDALWR